MCDVRHRQGSRLGSAAGPRNFRRCRIVASLARSKGRGRASAGLLIVALLGASLSRALGQQAADSSCPVSLVYAADLGPGGAGSKNPTFAGRVNITNTASQVAVHSCKVGWNFTDGESIVGAGNVSAPFVADSLAAHQVILHAGNASASSAGSVNVGESLQGSFLGTKSSIAANASNPSGVAQPKDMAFNNLPCTLVGMTAMGLQDSPLAQAVPARPNPDDSDPTSSLLIQYAPIEYVNLPIGIFATAFTQFLVRVANVANSTNIPLQDVTYQYWFNGPDGVDAFAQSSPADLFELQCSDATTGCDAIRWNFTRGLKDTRGALFVLNVGFQSSAGSLRQIAADSIGNFTAGTQAHQAQNSLLNVMQVLASIQIKRLALVQMNQTLDYSFENTPVSNQQANGSQTVPRKPVPNWGMPAYLDGALAWGSPPKQQASHNPPPPAQPLPPGIHCSSASVGNASIQHCMLMAEYCCDGARLSPTIPAVFPPARPASESTSPPSPPALPPPPRASSATAAAQNAAPGQYGGTPADAGSSSSSTSAAAIAGPVAGGVVAMAVITAVLAFLYLRRRRRLRGLRLLQDAEACRRSSGSESDHGKRQLVAAGGGHSSLGGLSLEGQEVSVLSWGDWRQQRPAADGQTALLSHGLLRSQRSSGATDGSALWMECHEGLDPYGPAAEAARRWASQPALVRISSISDPGAAVPASPNFLLMAPSNVGQTVQADAGQLLAGQSSSGSLEGVARRLVRRHSWGGPLQMPDSELPTALQQAPAATSMGSPFMPPLPCGPGWGHSMSLEGVDLHVDYAKEIEPHLGRRLGTGGFGDVFEAEWRGRRVAVKKLPQLAARARRDGPSPEAQYAALIAEIQLSCRFKSSRLVSVLGACLGEPAQACLIMELVEGGSLAARIHDRKKRRLTYMQILRVAHDVAAGLAYLHPAVVHRDLKPHNVLLEGGPAGRAKVADFGISRVKDPTKSYLSATNNNGTPMYMAPEQFNGSHLDEKVDVYSLGCILNECWTRQQPWRDSEHFFQIIKSVAIDGERPAVASDTPPQLRRLIRKCWEQDPRHRPSCTELVRFTDILMQHEVARLRAAAGRGSGVLPSGVGGNGAIGGHGGNGCPTSSGGNGSRHPTSTVRATSEASDVTVRTTPSPPQQLERGGVEPGPAATAGDGAAVGRDAAVASSYDAVSDLPAPASPANQAHAAAGGTAAPDSSCHKQPAAGPQAAEHHQHADPAERGGWAGVPRSLLPDRSSPQAAVQEVGAAAAASTSGAAPAFGGRTSELRLLCQRHQPPSDTTGGSSLGNGGTREDSSSYRAGEGTGSYSALEVAEAAAGSPQSDSIQTV